MPGAQKQKLYCYVDETGQDTDGRLFLVSVVVTEQEQEAFARELERIEAESGVLFVMRWKGEPMRWNFTMRRGSGASSAKCRKRKTPMVRGNNLSPCGKTRHTVGVRLLFSKAG
jgi:hypothetical protein